MNEKGAILSSEMRRNVNVQGGKRERKRRLLKISWRENSGQ